MQISISKKLVSLLMALLMLTVVMTASVTAVSAAEEEPDEPDVVAAENDDDDMDEEDPNEFENAADDIDEYLDPMEGVIPVSMYAQPQGSGKVEQNNYYYFLGYEKTVPVTFTAVPDGGEFIRWEFEGSYEIVSGALDEKVITLKPTSAGEVTGYAYFTEAKSNTETKTPATSDEASPSQKGSDKKATSPKTGDMTLMVIGSMLAAACAGAFAVRNIRECH